MERGQWYNIDDTDAADFEETRRMGWQGNPLLALRWAILEDWIWDFLQGRKGSEIDVEAMGELLSFFPTLPPNLPERLLALTSQEKQRICANRTAMGNRRGQDKWHHGPARAVKIGATSQGRRMHG